MVMGCRARGRMLGNLRRHTTWDENIAVDQFNLLVKIITSLAVFGLLLLFLLMLQVKK